ncbi:hypothetical protein [Haloarchaeobius sp. DFWS5]|uniref:hypothetical protein n=1 Tax=Haloarchaeobius sp. DFWS5 TaxID=3446114 RepID=UPI003EBD4E4B
MSTVRTDQSTSGNLADLLGLLAVPLLLCALHVATPAARDVFALRHDDLTVVTLWSSAFVHANDAHLYSNLLGYSLAAVPTYLLYLHWNRRRAFWVTVAVTLVVVPPIVNVGSVVYFDSQGFGPDTVSRGFSGVVAAFAGLGLAAVVSFVAESYGLRRAYWVAQALTLVVAGVMLAGLTGGVVALHAGLVGVGVLLSVTGLLTDEPDPLAGLRDHRMTVVVVSYVVVTLLLVVYLLFPADVTETSHVTNLVAHAVGLVAGVVLPGLGRFAS